MSPRNVCGLANVSHTGRSSDVCHSITSSLNLLPATVWQIMLLLALLRIILVVST